MERSSETSQSASWWVDSRLQQSFHVSRLWLWLSNKRKLTGQKLKRRLKRDAVPSKFDFPTSSTSTSKKQRVASERRAQERARREVSQVLLIFYRNINSKCLRVCQSQGLSNVSRFHYDLYLYEKAYFRHVVPGKIKRESCFVLEKQHQRMAQYKIDISLLGKV